MRESDIAFVCEIEKECFSLPWSEEGLRNELSNEQARFFVLESEGTVVAYMGMHIVLDECYITNVAVKAQWRKNGFGEALVENSVKTAGQEGCSFISLEVRKSNEKAISLYTKCGFKALGERKNFYSAPVENAVIMTRYFS